jgi:hypothetical protein
MALIHSTFRRIMMISTQEPEPFSEAEADWDLARLYSDLTAIKGKSLSPIEKLHLRGLLCGCSPTDIAVTRHKTPRAINVNLCRTVYYYVKILVNRGDEKVDNWRTIREWLEEAGYKNPSTGQSTETIPMDATVQVSNASIKKVNVEKNTMTVNIKENTITIDINIQLVGSLPTESSVKKK